MTLPITTILPIHSQKIKAGGDDLDQYLKELVFALQSQYESVALGINGTTLRSVDEGSIKWEPILRGAGSPSSTFTYDYQIGTVLRQGLMVDICFDVKWTSFDSGTPSGNMYIDLPYKVAVVDQKPFVGSVQPSIFTFTGGTACVINAIENTYRLEIWNIGDGFTTANQDTVSAGQLAGHIRYAGQAIERD